MLKVKIGDEVQIMIGRDKGKKGKVEKVYTKEGSVVVTGVNIYKRHKKATRTQKAGIFEIARPLNIAKVSVVCPKCSKVTRVGFNIGKESKKRICKKCKGEIS